MSRSTLQSSVDAAAKRLWESGLAPSASSSSASGSGASYESTARDFASPWARQRLVPKIDAHARPLWVTGDGMIIVEYFSQNFTQLLRDFLVAIAEPVSRPSNMHVYQLKKETLYAAASSGIETDAIIDNLEVASKAPLPESVKEFIKVCTQSCGKVNIVLTDGRFMVETGHHDVLSALLGDSTISAARARGVAVEQARAPTAQRVVQPPTFLQAHVARDVDERRRRVRELTAAAARTGSEDELMTELMREFNLKSEADAEQAIVWAKWLGSSAPGAAAAASGAVGSAASSGFAGGDESESAAASASVERFEIRRECVQDVKAAALALGYPMLEEYDYQSDTRHLSTGGRSAGSLGAPGAPRYAPKPATALRHYQQDCLQKVFGNKGRARSGQIVLPCGAGKTLVGVAATWTVNKPTLVLCTSNVAVMQWKAQFELWTNAEKVSVSFMYRYTLRESCSQFDSPPLTYLTIALTYERGEGRARRRRERERRAARLHRKPEGRHRRRNNHPHDVLHVRDGRRRAERSWAAYYEEAQGNRVRAHRARRGPRRPGGALSKRDNADEVSLQDRPDGDARAGGQ
jgi:hypothetical protein